MTSSTSNSKPHLPRARWALLVVALSLAAVALLRADRQFATAPNWYWRAKVGWHRAADIVLAGDSQVYRGLDPSQFEKGLAQRCLNFGFSGGGFDERYLDAIEQVVNPATPRPIVVLGVSASSLTPRAAARNGFVDALREARLSPIPAHWFQRWEKVESAFRPVALDLIGGNERPRRAAADGYEQVFHRNGWVESDRWPRNPEAGPAVARQNHADGNVVDPVIIDRLARRVSTWRARGWQVVAFIPPSTPAAARITTEVSRWDVPRLAGTLRQAGALWLEFREEDYESYDGVHLTAASARKLSQQLAEKIAGADRGAR